MVKIAIVYTGEVRTIEMVIDTFKKNVLIDKDRDVFAVLQTDNILYFDNFVKQKLYGHLKYLRWFDRNEETWSTLRDGLCRDMNIVDEWVLYLKEYSGSLIEYYQMYLAFLDIKKYEKFTGIKYDYILRIRCDCIITRPLQLDLDSINIQERFNIIKEKHGVGIGSIEAFEIFMNSLYDINRINVTEKITRTSLTTTNFVGNSIEEIRKYLDNGNFLLTLRENVCYFGRRDVFEIIHKLGIQYGKSHTYNAGGYWFDSESQLKSICLDNEVDMYDSTTDLEVKSLYEYDRDNYYIKGSDELIENDEVFFFLKRQ